MAKKVSSYFSTRQYYFSGRLWGKGNVRKVPNNGYEWNSGGKKIGKNVVKWDFFRTFARN